MIDRRSWRQRGFKESIKSIDFCTRKDESIAHVDIIRILGPTLNAALSMSASYTLCGSCRLTREFLHLQVQLENLNNDNRSLLSPLVRSLSLSLSLNIFCVSHDKEEVDWTVVVHRRESEQRPLLIGLLVNGRRCNLGCTPGLDPGTMGIIPP